MKLCDSLKWAKLLLLHFYLLVSLEENLMTLSVARD